MQRQGSSWLLPFAMGYGGENSGDMRFKIYYATSIKSEFLKLFE
jgi:hypothetical protein